MLSFPDERVATGAHAPDVSNYSSGQWLTSSTGPSYAAVLFDLDGVLTPTAEVHERAWTEMFNRFLADHADEIADPSPFTEADYLAYVDGRPSYDGVRTFLASRDVTLPEGQPTDPPGDTSICALGNRKNEAFNEIVARDGIDPYPAVGRPARPARTSSA